MMSIDCLSARKATIYILIDSPGDGAGEFDETNEENNRISYDVSLCEDLVLSPVLTDDDIRIVLTWGQYPEDLEAHLTGPTPTAAATTASTGTRSSPAPTSISTTTTPTARRPSPSPSLLPALPSLTGIPPVSLNDSIRPVVPVGYPANPTRDFSS